MQGSKLRRFRAARFWRTATTTFVTLFALGFAAIEGTVFFFDAADRLKLPVFATWFGVIVVVSAVRGFVAGRRTRSHRVEISPEASVEIVVDDFLNNLERFPRASCVFGVNDRFSVAGLAPTSLHACFLDRFAQSDDSEVRQRELDGALKRSRLDPGVVGALDDESRTQHAGGTVVAQRFDEHEGSARHAFLLVNSSRGKLGFTQVEEDAHVRAIWDFHAREGHVSNEVVFSLVGTGESRRLGRIQSAVQIIDEYFARREHERLPAIRRLVVSIHPQTVLAGEVDLESLYDYLDARAAVHRAMDTSARD